MRTFMITIGAPGSGKSTWLKNKGLEKYVISPDAIRTMVQSPETNIDGKKTISQKNDSFVWDLVMDVMEDRMKRGDFFIIDATHTSTFLINKYRALVKKYRYRVIAVDFRNIPLEEVLKRNAGRLLSQTEAYKYVPEEAIKKLHERALNLIIPSWIKTIKYDDSDAYEDAIGIFYELHDVNKIFVVGDIHGSVNELKRWKEIVKDDLDNQENLFVFVGDYFDRYDENTPNALKETFEILYDLIKRKNVLFLVGNHEWDVQKYIDDYIRLRKDIDGLKIKVHLQTKDLEKLEEDLVFLDSLLTNVNKTIKKAKSSWLTSLLVKFYNTSLKEMHEAQKQSKYEINIKEMKISKLKKKLDKNKQKLKQAEEEYQAEIRKHISTGTRRTLFNLLQVVPDKEVKDFFKRLAQIALYKWGDKVVFINHGGFPTVPTIFDATKEFIYGIGTYGDEGKIIETWYEKTKEKDNQYIQIFGHRDVFNIKNTLKDKNCIIVNGDADKGPDGALKFCVIEKDSPDILYFEVKSEREVQEGYKDWQSKKIETWLKEDKEHLEKHGILATAKKHRGIRVKNTGIDDIYAINFTSSVFKSGEYDSLSIHARGLFVRCLDGDCNDMEK